MGPPSAGKSTLLNTLTNAQSKIAPYAFTTVSVIPGMMKYKDAYIQILDVPGLIEGAEEGKGRGREVISVVRGADLLVLMSDISRPEAIERIANALERNGIRIDKRPPEVTISKNYTGGLMIKTNLKQDLDEETIKEVAREMGHKNGEISIREKITMEQLIDSFSKSRVYIPSIRVLNKADIDPGSESEVTSVRHPDAIGGYLPASGPVQISAEHDKNLDKLREAIWDKLDLTRVFLVRRDQEPSEDNPIITNKNITLKQLAQKIGPEFAKEKSKAKIWGNGAKFEGQTVSLKQRIEDGMYVRFI